MQTPLRGSLPVRRWLHSTVRRLLLLGLSYIVLAYVITPLLWRHYEHHPALARAPKIVTTQTGAAAEPLNVGFLATEHELSQMLSAAGWLPVDTPGAGSAATDVAIGTRYLSGQPQSLLFQRAADRPAEQRHWLRLWRAPMYDVDDRPLWLGTATLNRAEPTPQLAPDIDAARDLLILDVQKTGWLARVYQVTGVGATWRGFSAGRWYYSDGELTIGALAEPHGSDLVPPISLPNPAAVRLKNRVWAWLRR